MQFLIENQFASKFIEKLQEKFIAYEVCGTQPMTMPTGLIFNLKTKNLNDKVYVEQSYPWLSAENEQDLKALYKDPITFDLIKQLDLYLTDNSSQNHVTIEKSAVEARTRQLRTNLAFNRYNDLKNVLSIDSINGEIDQLIIELIAEFNKSIISEIYRVAKQSDIKIIKTDSKVEVVKKLILAIEEDAVIIEKETCRGKGNILILSPNLATVLVMTDALTISGEELEKCIGNVWGTYPYCGKFKDMKVFIDPYAEEDYYIVGYKGTTVFDAGLTYCPYNLLQVVRATNTETLEQTIGFNTRFGISCNPVTGLSESSNVYYRKNVVTGF